MCLTAPVRPVRPSAYTGAVRPPGRTPRSDREAPVRRGETAGTVCARAREALQAASPGVRITMDAFMRKTPRGGVARVCVPSSKSANVVQKAGKPFEELLEECLFEPCEGREQPAARRR